MSTLKPSQALFLWRMIASDSIELREPKMSAAKPDIKKDKQALIEAGYLSKEKRGRAHHLLLTDKAWAWANEEANVQLMKSNSRVGAEALEGLLRRLIPFLQKHEIPLTALFMGESDQEQTQDGTGTGWADSTLPPRSGTLPGVGPPNVATCIEQAYLSLTGGRRQTRVSLADLRPLVHNVTREDLDRQLLVMQRTGQLVLYREDNTVALTHAVHEAALVVGGSPRREA